MAKITVTAVSINGIDFVSAPLSLDIEATNIKYVFQHLPTSPYDVALTEIIYYDEQAARIAHVLVTETAHEVFALYDGFLIITSERIDGVANTKPMLINNNSIGYGVALSPKDDSSLSVIAYDTLVNTFQVNDIITGGTSKATARIIFDDGIRTMYVHPISGTLQAAETITGTNTPTPTANVVSYTAALQKYYQYQLGHKVSQKKKDMVALLNSITVTDAITAVSLANNTFTLLGDHHLRYTLDVPFFVDGSTGNDGLYSVISSTYDGTNTIITVAQPILSSVADGNITTV